MRLAISTLAILLAAGIAAASWFSHFHPHEPTPPAPKHTAVIIDNTVKPTKPSCSSCGDARHPTPPLLKEEYLSLIARYALEPVHDSAALDSLCFYGVQTRDMLNLYGADGLDNERAALLSAEVSRTHAYLSVRVIDTNGVVRVNLARQKVQIDERNHYAVTDVHNVIPPEVSGTIKRVGLHHIWARF